VEKRQQSFGYRMMMKMGWKEDTGLGKEENGSLTHIRIKKRADNVGALRMQRCLARVIVAEVDCDVVAGIGAEADVTGNSSLTSAVSDFNSILQSLSQYHAPAVGECLLHFNPRRCCAPATRLVADAETCLCVRVTAAASDTKERRESKSGKKASLAHSRVTYAPSRRCVSPAFSATRR
jgi:hypothetical protein